MNKKIIQRQIIYFLCTVIFCNTYVLAKSSTWFDISADFSCGEPIFSNITVSEGSDGSVDKNAGINGSSAWKLLCDTLDPSLYFDVDDELIFDSKGLDTKITVRYFDSAEGHFCIRYSSTDGTYFKYSEKVVLEGSNEWKEYVFSLQDAAFDNKTKNSDFSICLWYPETLEYSKSDIFFSYVSVDIENFVDIQAYGANAGNVFKEGEGVEFYISAQNNLKKDIEAELSVKTIDSDGNITPIGSIKTVLSESTALEKTFYFTPRKKGVYKLLVEIRDISGQHSCTKAFEFSYTDITDSGGTISNMAGFVTHMGHGYDCEDTVSLLDSAGVKWIRDGFYWESVETVKGEYDFENQAGYDGIMDAIDKGINVLAVMGYGNKLYDCQQPITDEQIKAFANYCKAAAQKFKGKIKAYEIWNEWNGTWGGGQSPEAYAKMIRAAYAAIKTVDINATVIAGACIADGNEWFEEFFSAGGYNYCDAISYHPYCAPQDPDTIDYRGNIYQNLYVNRNTMRKYGAEKPIWITEIGWYDGDAENAVPENLQAAYMVRTYLNGAAYGADKIFWYDFQNDGADINDSEQNFGIIKDNSAGASAKEAYSAFCTMMKYLGGAELVREYTPNKTLKVQHYVNRKTNSDIAVIWNSKARINIDITGTTASMHGYDMMGNSCTGYEIGDEPVYLVGDAGAFNINDIQADKDNFAMLSIGDKYPQARGLTAVYSGVSQVYKDNGAYFIENTSPMKFDIEDTYISGKNDVTVRVEFYDGEDGGFKIAYNNEDGKTVYSSAVDFTASEQWKSVDVLLQDAVMNNGLDNADFKIEGNNAAIHSVRVISEYDQSAVYAQAALGETSRFENITVRAGENSTKLQTGERNGRECWITNKDANSDCLFLYGDVSNSFIYNEPTHVILEVDYFDEGNGKFRLVYTAADSDWKVTDVVNMGDTKTWKTAVYDLTDARFNNSLNDADFRIQIYDWSMGKSNIDVAFSGIRIRKMGGFNVVSHDDSRLFTVKGNLTEEQQAEEMKDVTVFILYPGKDLSDIESGTESFSSVVRYAEQLSPDENGYFEKTFKMNVIPGKNPVYIQFPGGEIKAAELYNNFRNMIINPKWECNGIQSDTLSKASEVRFTGIYSSKDGSEQPVVYMAVYNQNRELINILCSSIDLSGDGKAMLDLRLELSEKTGEYSYANVYVWDGGIKPLCKYIQLGPNQ